MDKYPIGPETLKKAGNTQSGKLAAALNRVLYVGDTKTITVNNCNYKGWVTGDEIWRGDAPLPDGVPAVGHKDCYFETEQLLRAIRDHLEFMALKEVIP